MESILLISSVALRFLKPISLVFSQRSAENNKASLAMVLEINLPSVKL